MPTSDQLDAMGDGAEELLSLVWGWQQEPVAEATAQLRPAASGQPPTAYDLVEQAVKQLLSAMGGRNIPKMLENIGEGYSPVDAIALDNEEASNGEQ